MEGRAIVESSLSSVHHHCDFRSGLYRTTEKEIVGWTVR
jgi:hypothetical protein